jgi:integrase/recombinase XerD
MRGFRSRIAAGTGRAADHQGLLYHLELYLENLKYRNYSESTTHGRKTYLEAFVGWCEERAIIRPGEVTKFIIQRYQRTLFNYRKTDGNPLSYYSQRGHLTAVKEFFSFLSKQNYILYNPAADMEMPKAPKRIPRNVLTVKEIARLMDQANFEDPIGLRDRAIMETLYSTGMRRAEISNLKILDVNMEAGTVFIREGKGKKDRMIPIGQRAVMWIDKYLLEVRPSLIMEPDDFTLFLTTAGNALSYNTLSRLIRGYVKQAGCNYKGACHLFRHAMATHMLENGADIRYIQHILGHEKLDTTQIYTRVSIRKLKEVHEATHPAKMERN